MATTAMLSWWFKGQDLLTQLREDNTEIQSKYAGGSNQEMADAWYNLNFLISHNPEFADLLSCGTSTASGTVSQVITDATTYLKSIPVTLPDGNGGSIPLMCGDRPATMFDVMMGADFNISVSWDKVFQPSSGSSSPVLSTQWFKEAMSNPAFHDKQTGYGVSKDKNGFIIDEWATDSFTASYDTWASYLQAGPGGDPTALNNDVFE